MRDYYNWFLKGIPFGLANILPGLSGGTIALLLGFYSELLSAIKNIKLIVLIPLAVGTLLSIVIGSRVVVYMLELYTVEMAGFLIGLIFASIYLLFRTNYPRNISGWSLFTVGLVLSFTLAELSFPVGSGGRWQFLSMFLAGGMASVAMLLPGISGAALLMIFGYYELALETVVNFDWYLLIAFGFGAASGLIILAYILSYLMKHYYTKVIMLLTGMVLGSSQILFKNYFSWHSIFWLILGFISVILLEITNSRFSQKVSKHTKP